MRVTELDDLIAKLIKDDDHPEIVGVRSCVTDGQPKAYHSRLRVTHADGGESIVMVYRVTGPKIPRADTYVIPKEAL